MIHFLRLIEAAKTHGIAFTPKGQGPTAQPRQALPAEKDWELISRVQPFVFSHTENQANGSHSANHVMS